jgi:uncharacterized protein (TIGR02996 family)
MANGPSEEKRRFTLEEAFHGAIKEHPKDSLIYADWPEEQGSLQAGVKRALIRAVAGLAEDERKQLGEDVLLRLDDPEVRRDAVLALGESHEVGTAVPALTAALKDDDDPVVRREAARALGQIGEKAEAAMPDLAAALKDENANVRWQAARALGRVGPKAQAAVPALAAALEDEDTLVRREAARSLGLIGKKGYGNDS